MNTKAQTENFIWSLTARICRARCEQTCAVTSSDCRCCTRSVSSCACNKVPRCGGCLGCFDESSWVGGGSIAVLGAATGAGARETASLGGATGCGGTLVTGGLWVGTATGGVSAGATDVAWRAVMASVGVGNQSAGFERPKLLKVCW